MRRIRQTLRWTGWTAWQASTGCTCSCSSQAPRCRMAPVGVCPCFHVGTSRDGPCEHPDKTGPARMQFPWADVFESRRSLRSMLFYRLGILVFALASSLCAAPLHAALLQVTRADDPVPDICL